MQRFGRPDGVGGGGKDRKTGGARARHAGQLATRLAAQRQKHVGDDRRQRDCRAFKIVRLAQEKAHQLVALGHRGEHRQIGRHQRRRRRLPAGKHRLGRKRDAGIDQHALERRQREGTEQDFADAAHQPCTRFETDRHVGAGGASRRIKQRIVRREIVGPRQQPQRRGRVGRSAAEACRHRQPFFEIEGASADGRQPVGERAGRLEHEIVGARAGLRRARPTHIEGEFAARRKA